MGEEQSPEMLTVAEIAERYAGQWVLIGDPQTEPGPRLLGGRAVFASPRRQDVYNRMVELKLPRGAVRFNGPSIPPGSECLL